MINFIGLEAKVCLGNHTLVGGNHTVAGASGTALFTLL